MATYNEYTATITAEVLGHEIKFELPYLDTDDLATISEAAYETISESIYLTVDDVKVSAVYSDEE
jgi:hypothetical protein